MSLVAGRRPGLGLRRITAALVRQRRRLVLATVAIALGVGYLAGALTLLDRVAGGLNELAAAGGEKADLVVEGEVAYESSLEQVRRLVPKSVQQSLEELGEGSGIASASSSIEDVAVIVGADGKPIVAPGLSEQPLGGNWPDDPAVARYDIAEGEPPTDDDQVVIDRRSADEGGFEIGDTVIVVGKAKAAPYRISGIVDSNGGLPEGTSLALLTTAEARLLFDRPLEDNSVAVRAVEGADPDDVAASITRVLPPGIEVVDGETASVHRQESLTRSFSLIRGLILGFAGLALVVGMITVANSLSLLYAERRRTLAALRLVGAKSGQLLRACLVEAAILATVASLIGVPVGLLLGRVIEAALGALGTSIPVAGSVVSWSALLWAFGIGVVVTVLAAVVPAARACRVSPVEAVTEAVVHEPRPIRRVLLTGVVVSTAAALITGTLLAWQNARTAEGSTPMTLSTSAAITAAVAVAAFAVVLFPLVISHLVSIGIRVTPSRSAALRSIAARDVLRNRSRTAATTGALMLATAVVGGLAVFLASFTATVDGEVRELVRSDLVVDSGTFTRGGLPADLLQKVSESPDVAAVSGWQVGRATLGSSPVRLTGIDGSQLDQVIAPEWSGTPPSSFDERSVLLSKQLADSAGVGTGDQVVITFTSGGAEVLEVAGVYESGSLLLGDAVVDRSTLLRQVPATTDLFGLVTLNADDAESREAVRSIAESFGVTSVLRPEEFVDRRSDLLEGFQRVIQWMLLFTLVQALVGVINTLLLSVGERRKEFGLLRIAGASRRQVLRLVLVEGGALAICGTVLGLGIGAFGAWLGVRTLGDLGAPSFIVPVGTVAVTGLAAMALGLVAALVPARWASAVPPLEAVADAGATFGPSETPDTPLLGGRSRSTSTEIAHQRPLDLLVGSGWLNDMLAGRERLGFSRRPDDSEVAQSIAGALLSESVPSASASTPAATSTTAPVAPTPAPAPAPEAAPIPAPTAASTPGVVRRRPFLRPPDPLPLPPAPPRPDPVRTVTPSQPQRTPEPRVAEPAPADPWPTPLTEPARAYEAGREPEPTHSNASQTQRDQPVYAERTSQYEETTGPYETTAPYGTTAPPETTVPPETTEPIRPIDVPEAIPLWAATVVPRHDEVDPPEASDDRGRNEAIAAEVVDPGALPPDAIAAGVDPDPVTTGRSSADDVSADDVSAEVPPGESRENRRRRLRGARMAGGSIRRRGRTRESNDLGVDNWLADAGSGDSQAPTARRSEVPAGRARPSPEVSEPAGVSSAAPVDDAADRPTDRNAAVPPPVESIPVVPAAGRAPFVPPTGPPPPTPASMSTASTTFPRPSSRPPVPPSSSMAGPSGPAPSGSAPSGSAPSGSAPPPAQPTSRSGGPAPTDRRPSSPTPSGTGPSGPGPARPPSSGQVPPGRHPAVGAGPGSGVRPRTVHPSLASVVGRLHPISRTAGAGALMLLSGALVDDEVVEHVVQGRVRQMECVVARTDRRVVVVVDRPGRPVIDSLHPTRTIIAATRVPSGEYLNVSVTDRDRRLDVTGVRDFAETMGLVTPPPASRTGYF